MLDCSPEERPLDAPQGRRVQDDDAEHDEALKLKVKFTSEFALRTCNTKYEHDLLCGIAQASQPVSMSMGVPICE